MTEMTREEAIQNVEKSVEAMVKMQWELHSYQTLTAPVREVLAQVGIYYLDILMRADFNRAMALAERLADERISLDAEEVASQFENLLKEQN